MSSNAMNKHSRKREFTPLTIEEKREKAIQNRREQKAKQKAKAKEKKKLRKQEEAEEESAMLGSVRDPAE